MVIKIHAYIECVEALDGWHERDARAMVALNQA